MLLVWVSDGLGWGLGEMDGLHVLRGLHVDHVWAMAVVVSSAAVAALSILVTILEI
jgi:hypothetical protein